MTKPNFDLKNVGGQQKKWTDGTGEMRDDSGWLEDLKMLSGCSVIGLLLLITGGSLIYGFFKIIGKF